MDSLKLILVVDDTLANLEVISEALEDAGYEVATAIDGERALKRVQTHPPDLILLDIQMPGIDGFETCQRLKSDPATASIPVIFMTAMSDIDSKVKGFNVGAVDYITKPFQTEEVLARISTQLQLRYLTQHLEDCVAERTAKLQMAIEQLHQSQLQLIQSEKMSALGNLVAGVAHEINNPVGCIIGNVEATQEYIDDLFDLIDLYHQELPHPTSKITEKLQEIDLDYVREDLPKLVRAMQNGGDRIKAISKSLRTFSRADTDSKQKFDLHEGLESTLLILRHRLKANEFRPAIEIVQNYNDLPLIECFPGPINQAFMNIIANSIDVFDENNIIDWETEKNSQKIIISTKLLEGQVQIAIQDNGRGISEEVQKKIFEHSFTTKGVGKGTGLGLAITRQIVEEKHGGTITVNSIPGKGTEFIISLPI